MKILLDTCTFLWIINDSKELSARARKLFLDKRNEAFFSVVSVWEIMIKYQLKRLPLPQPPETLIPEQCRLHAIEPLSLASDDVFELRKLPPLHDDPFDRMLVCQALAKNMTLLTPDKVIRDYPAESAW